MKISKIVLKNYRNYETEEIDFADTINIIYGNNGSGKSNLIEGIYLLSLTKSFRTNNENNLIMNNKGNCTVEGIIKNDDTTKYKINISEDKKNVFIDNDRIKKLSDYVSRINIILFNPLDTRIINDPPAVRRKNMDIEISQIDREYLILLSNYNKVLKNRNAYLKQLYINGNSSKEYLDILTNKLIDIGLEIYKIRNEFFNKINNSISKIYKEIFKNGDLKIKYISKYSNKNKENLLELYKKNYRKEMELGKTIFGIHHDDFNFILDNKNIKDYGSIGQQKNAIISYKLSEILIIKDVKDDYPILILDDLFSELDKEKINNILSMLNNKIQTFITTTDIDDIDKKLLKGSRVFKIDQGVIERKQEYEK